MKQLPFIDRIKLVLFNPKEYFRLIEKEAGIGQAFVYFIILFLLYSLLSLGVGMLFLGPFFFLGQKMFGLAQIPQASPAMLVLIFFIGLPVGILWLFVITGILHLWIGLFGGKGSYDKTFQLYAYGHTPQFLFGWIPLVNYFIWIWVMIVQIFGTIKLHKMTTTRSVLVYVIPILIALGLGMIIFILGLMLIGGGLLASLLA